MSRAPGIGLAVVVGAVGPRHYSSAGSVRQAVRWAIDDLARGATRVAIIGDDLSALLRELASLAREYPESDSVELSRHEIACSPANLPLLRALLDRLSGGRA